LQINIFTEISNFSYGVYGKNLSLELNKHIEVCLAPSFHRLTGVEKSEYDDIQKMLARLETIKLDNAGIMFSNGNQMFRFTGKKKIGFTFFFSDELEKSWINQLKQLDLICVPSKWQAEILKKHDLQRVSAIQPGVNLSIFKPRKQQNLEFSRKNKFKFFSIGKWDSRKNQKMALEAFCEEFSPEENVELYCMWHNPFLTGSFLPEALGSLSNKHKIYTKEQPENSTVFLVNPAQSFFQLARIYNDMHCGIFPFKSEASGLRLLECMTTGMPCIAANYSVVTEYVNEKNCYLLNNLETATINKDKQYAGLKGNWKTPDKNELRKTMRKVFSNYKEAQLKGQTAAVEMKRFFWWNSANKLLNCILNQ